MRYAKFLGVFSHAITSPTGQPRLHFVWQIRDEGYVAQLLDHAFQAKGEPFRITGEQYLHDFHPEPTILAMPLTRLDVDTLPPLEPSLPKPTTEDGETDALALFKQAEMRIRDTFRKTFLRLKRPRERQAAITTLEQLASTTENITEEHKHIFSDIGARLRKNDMASTALLFARRTVELSPTDDHAHFNLARVLCALHKFDEATKHIKLAMSLDANEPIYPRMLKYINMEKNKPKQVAKKTGRR